MSVNKNAESTIKWQSFQSFHHFFLFGLHWRELLFFPVMLYHSDRKREEMSPMRTATEKTLWCLLKTRKKTCLELCFNPFPPSPCIPLTASLCPGWGAERTAWSCDHYDWLSKRSHDVTPVAPLPIITRDWEMSLTAWPLCCECALNIEISDNQRHICAACGH